MKHRIALVCVVVSALALMTLPVAAQDFRGAISGVVVDSTGAALPGVTITVKNVDTNVATNTVTDSKGMYQIRYLVSGNYSVDGHLEGFKSVVRKGITVRAGDALRIDLSLPLGGLEESIAVIASAPLLDTTSGVTGQVIDSNQIEQLPLGDGTAYMLTRLAPGLVDSSDLHFARPMDNGNLAGIVANGAQGGNEFTLDGAPNRVSPNNTTPTNNSGVVGFSPPSDAIAEFKVQTNAFDAQSGHTAGAVVNLALKSGTNNFKGSVSYFNRSDSRSETPLLSKRAGAEKPTREYNRYAGLLSGPILRDRTFFMLSFERLRDVQPEPSTFTVPTAKMRAGDLSEFATTIYDPLTATGTNLARTAFTNNRIPNERINPVARAYAALYPEANRPGINNEDNYFTNMLRPYDYNAVLARVDHNFNGSNRVFLNGYWNKRQEDRYNWALGASNAEGGSINGVNPTNGFDYRSNTGGTLSYTSTLSDALMLDVIGAWSQFGEWRKNGEEIDPASLGFSPTAIQLMGDYKYLPFITFGGFSTTNANSRIASLGSQRSDWGTGFDRPFTNMSLVPTLSALYRSHSVRGGYELRHQRWQINNAAYGAGRYHFNGAYTRQNNSSALNTLAQSWAQFLLGLPTSGAPGAPATPGATSSQFEIAADADYRQDTHALFVQDDWHAIPNLTLNLGLRFERQNAMTEADNRNVAGFNRTISNPVEQAAMAKYATNPIPEIPVGSFRVPGGLEFADGPIYNNLSKLLPRVAASYMLNDRTVLRGGIGLFSYDYYFDAGNQAGFSQPTPIITTNDNGRTFLIDLTNPIPSGQLLQPTGSSRGAATNNGFTLGTVVPSDRKVPYYTRWQFGGQRDIGKGWVVEMNYVDSRGKNLPVTRELNTLPLRYLSTSRFRDTANESFLSQSVPNPFQGLMPGTNHDAATITRAQLLRPFPQYVIGANNGAVAGTGTISVGTEEYIGSDRYQAASIRIEKRFSRGDSFLASYTRSRARDKLNYLNPADGILEDRVSPNDRPNRATLGATLALPFGNGREWGSEWKGLKEAALGGWSISATYQYQDGFPLQWNTNLYYDPARDPRDLRSNIGGKCAGGGTAGLDCPAWDTSGFYADTTGRGDQRIVLANNFRYFPSTLPNVRTDNLHLMDVGIFKNFSLMYDMRLQFRVEVINALNYTVLWNPNQDPTNAAFATVNQDRNNPRDIQIGGKLTF